MPYYAPLKSQKLEDRKRIIAGINRIRQKKEDTNFPSKKTTQSLILGTWNIRNFDDDRFNYGPRKKEALHYIAEIVSGFDILAVQEICEDLYPLKKLKKLLGRQYDYILTDVTHSGLGGNKERLGFIFDKNKVRFTGIAGEVVLPDKMLISEVDDKKRQFARTPFGAEFQSGWFKFNFSTVHIYFGSNSVNSDKYKRRVQEIDRIAKYLAKAAKASTTNQILVGDFNIKKPASGGYNALEKNGFTMVHNRKGSNRDQTKHYDQISFLPRKNEVQLVNPDLDDKVFQFFDCVYRKEDFETYKPILVSSIQKKLSRANKNLAEATSKTKRNKAQKQTESLTAAGESDASLKQYYEEWRTFQMSDHLPLWIELKIDFSENYLDYLTTYNPKK